MLRKALQAAMLIIYSAVSHANPGTSAPPYFIFDPIKAQVDQCSQFGTDWRPRLTTAVRLAQSHTANLLPAESWAKMLSIPAKLDSNTPSKPQLDTCEKFVTYLSDPLLSNHIRGDMVSGLHLQAVTGCAAEFPDLANALRAAWVVAFRRNGLNTYEQLFDEYTRTSWRKPSGDQQQKNECEKTITFLKGPDFDKAASEQGVKQFFNRF